MRTCPECGEIKENIEFYKKLKGLSFRCKICTKKLHASEAHKIVRRKSDNDRINSNRELHHQKSKHYKLKYPETYILKRARKHAKDIGVEYNISKEDIIIPTVCPILDIPLYICDKVSDNSPSLDRIDNTKGYVKGNVVVVSNRVNRIKGDSSLEKFILMTEQYRKILNEEKC